MFDDGDVEMTYGNGDDAGVDGGNEGVRIRVGVGQGISTS